MRPAATFSDGAEVRLHTLADRFQGLEAVGALVGVDAAAFAIAVIDGDEDVRHALAQGDGWVCRCPTRTFTASVVMVAVVRLVRPLAVSRVRRAPMGRKTNTEKYSILRADPWLGDLDSNQGCPVQSRKFYR